LVDPGHRTRVTVSVAARKQDLFWDRAVDSGIVMNENVRRG